ncbi:MAG: type 1 glutamine amidotransferase [Pseudodesulfovibrio sp.]|nr:type 1 glutamine amidotransferase [Pseudodesulfovibrio sp.]
MRIHCLQHVDFEHPAYIGKWAAEHNHPITITRVDREEAFPEQNDFDMLVILGALASVYEVDNKPEVQREMAFIKRSVDAGKKTLGICFGAQLLAASIGGRAMPNKIKEIGWHIVSKTNEGKNSPMLAGFPDEFPVLLWHGDTFTIPPGAVQVLTSQHCMNEAYILEERVIGLQILPQVTSENLEEFIETLGPPTADGKAVQSLQEITDRAQELIPICNAFMADLLDRMTT